MVFEDLRMYTCLITHVYVIIAEYCRGSHEEEHAMHRGHTCVHSEEPWSHRWNDTSAKCQVWVRKGRNEVWLAATCTKTIMDTGQVLGIIWIQPISNDLPEFLPQGSGLRDNPVKSTQWQNEDSPSPFIVLLFKISMILVLIKDSRGTQQPLTQGNSA